MNRHLNKIKYVLIMIICLMLFIGNYHYASNVGNIYNPNYNQYYVPNYQYYPNYYGNYGYNPYIGTGVIPSDSYYYIAGYDRNPMYYSNGQPMITRVPIIAGNNYYPTRVANGIVYNAYVSISTWCNNNILTKDGVQDYYLNNAIISNETASSIVLDVNCAFKKGGVINGYTSFRINVDISRNRYQWRRLREGSSDYIDDNYEIYDYDSGEIIIIEQ